MADGQNGDKDKKKESPPVLIPGESTSSCQQRTLVLKHHDRDLQEDRIVAKELYNTKDTKILMDDASFYRLPSMAEKVKSSVYRKNVNNDFTAHFYLFEEQQLFKYKTMCRADKIHSIDSFNSQMRHVKRRPFDKVLTKMSALDWMGMVPLAAKYRKNRRTMVRPDMTLARQPLNVLCEPLVLHRMEFAMPFRTDRYLCPMLLVQNLFDIRSSLANSLLHKQKQENFYQMAKMIETFCSENQYYWHARRRKTKTLLLPFASVDPFFFWNRKRVGAKKRLRNNVRKFSLGQLRSHRMFDELNQLPADFPHRFYVFRAVHSLHLRFTQYPVTKREDFEDAVMPAANPKAPTTNASPNHIQKTYPNIHVEVFEKFDVEEGTLAEGDKMCDPRYLVIEPTMYQYGPDAAVTFRRMADSAINESEASLLVAQTYVPEEYDCASLGTVSGWSSESFATTMTEVPGDFIEGWKAAAHLEIGASCFTDEVNVQNVNYWKSMAQQSLLTRNATETQERLVKSCMSQSSKLCRNSKNGYLKDIILRDVPLKFVFFDYDYDNCIQRLNAVAGLIKPDEDTLIPVDKIKATILYETTQRILHYFTTRELDRYKGLDINFTWATTIFQEMLPHVVVGRLKNLIGSHDIWLDTSPVRFETARERNYKQHIMGIRDIRPWSGDMALNVIMFFSLLVCIYAVIFMNESNQKR